MLIARLKSHVNIGNLIFAVSLVFFVWLVWYFYTGLGGSLHSQPIHRNTGARTCAYAAQFSPPRAIE